MATEKQIEANRLNAQKCTGPRTPEGKAASSMNAFKTGLRAESEIIPGESLADYEELAADFYRDYAPIDAAERSLVDTMIKSEWLNRRFMSVTASIWRRSLRDDCTEALGFVFNMVGDSFVRADRCLNSAQRNFDKALTRLMQLQSKRATAATAQQPSAPSPQPLQSRDCKGAEPESPVKLVSFGTSPEPELEAPEEPPLAA